MLLGVGSVVRDYRILLGMKKGAQGLVFLVENMKTNKQYVLKLMFDEETKKDDFEKMIGTWKKLSKSKAKDFIVLYVEHFFENGNAIIIMEHCVNGDLETLIQKRKIEDEKFSESEVVEVLIEMMTILEEMGNLDFIHRDIKSANILIGADGKHKLGDFNTSKNLDGKSGTATMAGTLEYTPPEVINAEKYSFPADVYSVAVVLYQMMVGKTPFSNERGVVLMDLMLGKYTPISATLGYSAPLVDLVHLCLSRDPARRPTPVQVLASAVVVRARETIARQAAAVVEEAVRGLQKEVQELREWKEQAAQEMEEWKRKATKTEQEVGEWKKKATEEVGEWKRKATKTEKEVSELRGQLLQLQKEFAGMRNSNDGNPTVLPAPAPPVPISISSFSTDNLSIIRGWLGQSKTLTPLYQATKDGFTAAAFHERCDNKGATVTVITSSEGCVFGGYSAVPWKSSGGDTPDKSRQSFLFSVKNPRNAPPTKYDLIRKQYAICCLDTYGPLFGLDGNEICCESNSNRTDVNYTDLGGNGSYSNTSGVDGRTVFTGRYKFTAKEIEVYAVV